MSQNPSALRRLYSEFSATEPDARNSGIYAAKSGYHNTRAHHLAGSHNGSKSDDSIELAIDRQGPADKAAAVDISFDSARLRSDFRTIATYSQRLLRAFKARDPRLFAQVQGQPAGVKHAVVREFFGNTDLDRQVEGWSLHLGEARSSDSSHQWHIHLSFHRAFVESWPAVSGVLDVLLGRPITPPEVDDMAANAQQIIDMLKAQNAVIAAQTARQQKQYESLLFNVQQEDGRNDAERARDAALTAKVNEALAKLDEIEADLDNEGTPS